MKNRFGLVLAIGLCWPCLNAQVSLASVATDLVVAETGPHHRVWQRISSDGAGNTVTNAYTELATGLNYWNPAASRWEESKAQFRIAKDGHGIASNGQHKVILAPNINSGGSVDLLTPDGKRFLSNPMGLSFYDTATGTNVLIAEVKDCIGKFIPPNVILYDDAFTDLKGAIRYTYTQAGFEQDVLIYDSVGLGSPADYGLHPATTLLEMYSEFHESPTPEKTTQMTPVGLPDETLNFGQMGIGRGKAFVLNHAEQSIPVVKAWQVISGRTFLIESLPYLAAKPFLENLQAKVSDQKSTKVAQKKAPDRRTLIAMDAMRPRSQTKSVASIQPGRMSEKKGFVIDYITLNTSLTNYTFLGNTSYYLSGPCIMSGSNTVFEAGTVLKYAPTNSAKLTLKTPIDWQATAYRPVILTARDDSTVGETITTNSPVSGYYGDAALDIDALAAGTKAVLNNLRISFAKTAIAFNGSGHVFSHLQLVNCQNGFQPSSADFSLRNVLLHNVLTNFNGSSSTGRCEHLTVHGADWFNYNNTCAALFVTNSLLVTVTNLGTFTGDTVTTLSSDAGVFQPVGAGYHYLAFGSPYRNIGSQNINGNLLKELRNRTTFPPVLLTNHFTSDITLVPQARRESGALDVGYAYAPLDYCWSGLNLTNSTLVLTNGVAIGFYGSSGTILQSAGKFVSDGSPLEMNVLTPYSTVQEQPMFWGSVNNAIDMLTIKRNPTVLPVVEMRFTHAPSCAGLSKYYLLDLFWYPVGSITLSDCYLPGSYILWQPNADSRAVTLAFTNNVFERGNCEISFNSATVTPTSVHLRNNLIYKTQIRMFRANTNGTWGVFENLFYNFSYNFGNNPFSNGYNGYWSGAVIPNSIGGDVILPSTPSFLSGPLGKFYYPTNDGKLSLLINAGSRTADQAGLYHHTVRVDQTEEGNSTVEIGFHYKALTPPAVSLTSPLNNSVFPFPGNISLVADASQGDGTITQVEFFQGSNSLRLVSTPPYALTWSNVSGGNFTLKARATDNFGLISTSGIVNITVDVPPSVSISSPANNSVMAAPATIALEAAATDSDGSVAKVEYFESGTNKLGEATVSPFSVQWLNVGIGTYALTARATDNLGITSTSVLVNIFVDGSGDIDGDGLPDSWEIQYFGNLSQNATGDPDGDGLMNLEEYKLQTNPNQGNVASISFSPVGGSYASPQSVTITCPTAGVAIHYTTSGQEPTESDPVISSGSAIPVDHNLTVNAKAWKTGWVPSDTESEGYQITTTPVNLPPTLTVAPASGTAFLASFDAEILVEASDSDGAISKIQMFRGDYKIAETTSSPLRYLLENMAAGTYTFTAKAIDSAGAVTVSSPVTITVNASGPVVSLNGTQVYFTSSPGTLVANVVGVNLGGLTALTLNGSPLPLKTGDFTLGANLVEGENQFTLVATDDQNRTAQATTKVYFDSTRPVLSITAPADNSSFGTSRINVQGTFTESSLKRITVNGILAFINGNTFEARNVPLVAGANTITATGEDLAGNTQTTSVTITGTPDGNGNLTDPVQLEATPVGGFAPLNVNLTPQASVPGTIQQVLYDFDGDNITDQTATGLNPIAHTYASAGQYFPVVTIQTTAGRFSSVGGWNAGAALRINVQQPPVQQSVINITDPVDIKVGGPASHLYVLSRSSATITEFDANGTSVRSLAAIGTTPTGLDVDGAGNVYVALTGDNQVAKFNPTTTSFQLDTTFGGGGRIGKSDQSSGFGNGEFNAPFDVAVSADGKEIAVSDSGNDRIQRFQTADGAFICLVGSPGTGFGQLKNPKGISFDPGGDLFGVDSGNNRMVRFLGGEFYATFGAAGAGPGQYQAPLNLAATPQQIYVADTGNNRIQKLDPKRFDPVLQISSELGLAQPSGVAVGGDAVEERIYIADTGHNRIVIAQIPKIDPLPVWDTAKQNLIAGDTEAALTQFSMAAADSYRQLFSRIGGARLAQNIGAIGALSPIYLDDDEARYFFRSTIGAQQFAFVVTFTKENGLWKIRTF